MSFLRRLSRTKSVETQDLEEHPDKEKEKVKRRSSSGSSSVSKEEKYIKERKQSVKDKKKSKGGESGLNEMKYPLFYVHYLGRVPTKLEYGHEAIEGPVDQLCKLREREKLPKLVLTFNTDGLFFREITGPFNRVKKDGIFIYIPLHMVTYGVGSVAHPNVFACVTRTAFEKSHTSSDMFIVHAFLCDKTSVAQKMTYWQLQAYIEAYETLKRKKEIRTQRKLRNSMKGDNLSIRTSSTGLSASSREGSSSSRDSDRQRIGLKDSTFVNPKHLNDGNSEKKTKGSPVYARVRKTSSKSATGEEPTPEFTQSNPERHSATSIESRSSKDSALGDELTGEQIDDTPGDEQTDDTTGDKQTDDTTGDKQTDDTTGETPDDVDPFSFGEASTPVGSPVAAASSATKSDGNPRKGSSSATDDNFDTVSVFNMPIHAESVPRDEAFEKRISELNRLMQVDAEDLKAKMIKDNPTLMRRLYYGTIDRHGVFHREGLNLGMDADNSFA